MKPSRTLLALALCTASVLAPKLASAQTDPARKAAAAPADDGGYAVVFTDDDLLGGGLDGTAPIIRVNPRASRSLLIRPRTSFVPELLLSADAF